MAAVVFIKLQTRLVNDAPQTIKRETPRVTNRHLKTGLIRRHVPKKKKKNTRTRTPIRHRSRVVVTFIIVIVSFLFFYDVYSPAGCSNCHCRGGAIFPLVSITRRDRRRTVRGLN